MTDASRSKTLTPFSIRGSSGWSPRASAGARYETAVGSTAAMSRIAWPGVSRVMIMPGRHDEPADVAGAERQVGVRRREDERRRRAPPPT